MSYQWKTNTSAYSTNLRYKKRLVGSIVLKHPLEVSTVTNSIITQSNKCNSCIENGSSNNMSTVNLNELDPLTRMAVTEENDINLGLYRPPKDTFEPWSVKKLAILNKFTTQEKLSITTAAYNIEQRRSSLTGANSDIRGVSDKVLHRLEQLDMDNGSRQVFGGLTQEEYIIKLNQMGEEMIKQWQSQMKVNALKITIQCCKLLCDTSVIYFYPTKFVIITDILDKFGSLVYNRLRGRQSEEVSDEIAKETSKNWFFKVGSIRELLPRVLMELAILKSYCFMTPNPDYGRLLSRLLGSMWGIGCPVISIYMRCYICRVGMELIPDHKELYMQCFQDILLLHDQVLDNFRNSPQLISSKVSMDQYMSVLAPAVDWILQCLVYRGEHLHYTLQLVSSIPSFWKSVLVSSVLTSFPPSFIAEESPQILEIILSIETNLFGIIRNLGMCMMISQPSQDHVKEIWKTIWPLIKRIFSKEDYLTSCQVWAEFVVRHFDIYTLVEFLEDILVRITYRDVETFQGKLLSIIEKLLTFSNSITTLLSLEPFVKLVSLLGPDAIKATLNSFNQKHTEAQGDGLLVNTLMHLSAIIHDKVDALTPIDEVKQVGQLISGFIIRVQYGRDYEKQLQFYDEARGSFTNIEVVLVQLVHCVCRLGMQIREVVEGLHTKRTKGFVSACIAYGFITIPSLDNVLVQLQLYLTVGQVAFANQCLSQGDACLKAAITLLNESRDELSESEKNEFISNLMSTLLAVPDHPKEPMLYLLRGLISLDLPSPSIRLNFLSLLASYAQDTYPYSFDSVDSNNELYGGTLSFVSEVDSLASNILNDLLMILKSLGDSDLKKQSKLCHDLFIIIILRGDILSMGSLASKLWNLSRKGMDKKLSQRTFQWLERRVKLENSELESLVTKIAVD